MEEELWKDTYLQKEVKRSYNTFLIKFLYYFLKVFPQKSLVKSKINKAQWLSKRIKISGLKLQFLCMLKKRVSLASKTLNYIQRYQNIYKKKVISKVEKKRK